MFHRRNEPTSRWRRSARVASLLLACLAITLTLWAYGVDGTAAAVRTAASMALPVGLAWVMLLWVSLNQALAMRWIAAAGWGAAMLSWMALGNAWVSSALVDSVQWNIDDAADSVLKRTDQTPLRCLVVLGGATRTDPAGNAELSRDGERVFTAAQFFFRHRTGAIIVTGDSVGPVTPAAEARSLLISVGVPEDRVFTIGGINTIAEADQLKAFLQSPPSEFPAANDDNGGRIGLITSGHHMPRAVRLMRARGIDVVPLPVAYRNRVAAEISVYDWVPTVEHLETSTLAIREWIAWLMRR